MGRPRKKPSELKRPRRKPPIKDEAKGIAASKEMPADSEKPEEPTVADSTTDPVVAEQPNGPLASDAPEIMPVPEIAQISSFKENPIIHSHANVGAAQEKQATEQSEQPEEKTETTEKPSPPSQGTHAPKIEGEPEIRSSAPGSTDEPLTTEASQPQAAEGMPLSKTQARQTFEMFVGMFNHIVASYSPLLIKIKLPTEISSLSPDIAEKFKSTIDKLTIQNVELIKLNREEIEMLRDSAEAVIAKAGKELTPEQILIIVAVQILIGKMIIVINIRKDNKQLAVQIRNEVLLLVTENVTLRKENQSLRDQINTEQKKKAA